ncbi:MAG: CBS domain-containing protein [Bdellovibrionales bacterium]|nr:CBS domain-containing protein [Bdellovibrionales bacterium]
MTKSSKIGDSMVRDPITIEANVSITDAQEIMRAWGMRHLPVVEGEKLVGMLSDRDIYRAMALKKTHDLTVREAMSDDPYVVSAATSLADVAKAMAKNKFGCVVVTGAANRIRGIFTTTDALYILAQLLEDPDDDKFHVMNLEEYLASHQKMAV